ncbi:hypothetical protein D3C73_1638050 [compost metagenome]
MAEDFTQLATGDQFIHSLVKQFLERPGLISFAKGQIQRQFGNVRAAKPAPLTRCSLA